MTPPQTRPGYTSLGVRVQHGDQLRLPGLGRVIQGAPVAHGSWHGDNTNYKANHHRIRGGTTIIPDYFANTYLGGRAGVGFGGNYSGNAYCSQGPYLAAAMPPTDGVPQLDTITLINHPSSNRGAL